MIQCKQFFRFSILWLIGCVVFPAEVAVASDNVTLALITKVIREVAKRSTLIDWKTATKGETLLSGDQVRTGQRSLAVIKFKDNSMVRVREQSLLTINGEIGPRGRMKTIQLSKGSFGFSVKKQPENEQFRLTSPTSVASIRGTQGKLSGAEGNDTLIVTEGLVNLRNQISNQDIDVNAGFIAFSNQDGSITSRKALEQELKDAQTAATGGTTNELNLEFQDNQGNKKDLKIRYRQEEQ
ncbi:MAG: FecR domain-containing protein [Ignavibacteriae bacterium]|nr:FecR domain-containing protein [Ignavibacteriota bacterium]